MNSNPSKAIDILEDEFSISLRTVDKEGRDMCNLSDGILNNGIKLGEKIGEERGEERLIEKSVEVVKKLLAKNFTLDEALSVAGISKETYEENCNNS
jgi:hypothetical protein